MLACEADKAPKLSGLAQPTKSLQIHVTCSHPETYGSRPPLHLTISTCGFKYSHNKEP